MIWYILISAAGFLLGLFICHLIDKPKIKQVKENNSQLEIKRIDLETDIKSLSKKSNELQQLIKDQGESYQALILQSNSTQTKIDTLKQSLNDLSEQQKTAAEQIFETAKENAQNSFDKEVERLSCSLDKKRQEINNIYLKLLKEAKEDYENQADFYNNNLLNLKEQLDNLKNKVSAAVETDKRHEELKQGNSIYRLQISEVDKTEIKRLREVGLYLRDATPLNKIIYKYYYEKPYTDLVGQVVGQNQKTGIYKITNIENNMCYVGQAINIAERWRQHIKRGLGAETPTRNKLYPAMYGLGPENFAFEIIEECSPDKLNEREQYWQEFYHAKDYGYSMR